MPDKKLTDSEIIKALECAIRNDCDCNCVFLLPNKVQDVLDLINRLQEENERYKRYYFNHEYDKWEKEIKAEAYKECIEKVKEEINQALESNYKARAERENKDINLYLDDLFWNYCSGKIDCLRGLDDFCDKLLKELVGEDK